MDDATLVRLAREGDEGAFAELVARHRQAREAWSLAALTGAPVRVDPGVLAEASDSAWGAEHLAEATGYPDGTAVVVAEFHAQMERLRAEYLRRR
jgi:hypothetical protein